MYYFLRVEPGFSGWGEFMSCISYVPMLEQNTVQYL